MLVLKLAAATSDTALSVLRNDAVLDGDLNGVRFLMDLGSSAGWLGGNPTNGAVITDVAGRANGSFALRSGQTVTYAGGGFDFGANTDDENHVVIPASVAADIWGTGSTNQYFLVCVYVKLPISTDWNSASLIAPFLQFNANINGYPQGPDLCTIAQMTGGVLSFRRQTDGLSTFVGSNLTVPAADYGRVAQIAFWRNGTEQRSRLKTAVTSTLATTAATGSNNTGNFAANAGYAGVSKGFWAPTTVPQHLLATKFRLYRLFVENLLTSGRNPLTVLDADWTRVAARGVFS